MENSTTDPSAKAGSPSSSSRVEAATWLVKQFENARQFPSPLDDQEETFGPPTVDQILGSFAEAARWVHFLEDGDWETPEEQEYHRKILEVWHILLD
jgi:hypothetical protein